MRLITLTMLATMLLALSLPASADVSLADWCVNLNGSVDASSITNNYSNACNGGTNAPLAAVDTSGFDKTLENAGTNTLGSIVVTIGTGAQYAAVYMDYDLDYSTPLGSFTDAGSVNGSPSGTQSYELNDPNASNIFSDFSGITGLPNSNAVDPVTCAANGAPPWCDVSWALAESLYVDPLLYSGGTVTFTVSIAGGATGFYLEQTNQVKGDSIYLSDTVNLTPVGGAPPIPEPTSVLLLATAAAGALLLKKRSSANGA